MDITILNKATKLYSEVHTHTPSESSYVVSQVAEKEKGQFYIAERSGNVSRSSKKLLMNVEKTP